MTHSEAREQFSHEIRALVARGVETITDLSTEEINALGQILFASSIEVQEAIAECHDLGRLTSAVAGKGGIAKATRTTDGQAWINGIHNAMGYYLERQIEAEIKSLYDSHEADALQRDHAVDQAYDAAA